MADFFDPKKPRQAKFTGVEPGELKQVALEEFTGEAVAGRPFTPMPPPRERRPPPPAAQLRQVTELANPTLQWQWNSTYVLRDYQNQSLDQFYARRKGAIIIPTGTGKTLVAVRAIYDLRLPAAIIVPTLVLVSQWESELKRYANIDAGVYYGEEKRPQYVTVMTYQTLYRDPAIIRRFPVIIFDEGDLASAGDLNAGTGFYAVMEESARPEHTYVMVISATLPQDEQRRNYMARILPTIYTMSIEAGQAAGALAPLVIQPVAVNLTPEESENYGALEEKLRKISRALGTSNPADWARMTRSSYEDIRVSAFAALKAFSDRRQLLAFAKNKSNVVYNIAAAHPGQLVLVFSEAVGALGMFKEFLRQHGVRMETITGETPAAERSRILSEYGKAFYVLGSVRVLERGYNVPEISIGVVTSSGRGATQITQRLGRILRPKPGKTAQLFVVYAAGTIEKDLPSRIRDVIRGSHIPVVSEEPEEDFF